MTLKPDPNTNSNPNFLLLSSSEQKLYNICQNHPLRFSHKGLS